MAELMQHIKKVVDASGKKSLLALIFSMEGLKMFADGNIAYAKLMKGPTAGELVGEDYHGNRYYENKALPYHRKRWVLYKDTFDYNPTQIPPEWHAWVNHINDFPPSRYDYRKPIYAIEADKTKTGTSFAYAPKGAFPRENAFGKRTWKKYEPWVPGNSSGTYAVPTHGGEAEKADRSTTKA